MFRTPVSVGATVLALLLGASTSSPTSLPTSRPVAPAKVTASCLAMDVGSLQPGGTQNLAGTGGISFQLKKGEGGRIRDRDEVTQPDGTVVVNEKTEFVIRVMGDKFPLVAEISFRREGTRAKPLDVSSRVTFSSSSAAVAVRSKDGGTVIIAQLRPAP